MPPRRPAALAFLGLACLLARPSAAAPLPDTAEPSAARRSEDTVDSVHPGGEVALQDGRRIKLLDLQLPSEGRPAEAARQFFFSLVGAPVRLYGATLPDRWGRVAASLSILTTTPPVDAGELLVGEGLALVDPGERSELARPELLAVEARARAARRGLWRDSPWPIRAEAAEILAEAAGRFAVVEGRIVSVGERRDRTYLNFGRDWSRDFAVTIPKRVWSVLKDRGLTAAKLTGATVRVRGMVEMRRAPGLDIAVPEMLEVVAEGPGRTRSRAADP